MDSKKIFISFSTKQPDVTIAASFYEIFVNAGHQVFFSGKTIKVGSRWHESISEALEICDFFIILLSVHSSISDMVTEEVRRAKELSDNHPNRIPTILPVRLCLPPKYNLNYELSGYLNRLQYLMWNSSEDTERVVNEILSVINAGTPVPKTSPVAEDLSFTMQKVESKIPVPNAPLEAPGGIISLDSPYYITRKGERDFMSKILFQGSLLRIKGPRQYGKTSLMARIIEFAKQNGHVVIPLSLQQISIGNLKDLKNLLIQICAHASVKTGLPKKIKEFWDDDLMDTKMICTSYFEEFILPETGKPILLAIDEADRIFEFQQISTEFFGMLRFWHEEAKNNDIWKNMKIVISHSTEAYLAITDLNQSPFNVGIDNVLKEFTIDEVRHLSEIHQLSLTDSQIVELMYLIGGHPYLINKAFYELASKNYSFNDFLQQAPLEEGPYSDHLKRQLLNLSSHPNYLSVMKLIINNQTTDNAIVCNKLRAAGLVTGSIPNLKPNFKLYQIYFSKVV
jgi:serine/threonine-protein kinase